MGFWAVLTFIGKAVTGAVSAISASAIASFVFKAALYFGANLLLKKKKPTVSSLNNDSRTIMFRESAAPRRTLLGETKVSGPLTFVDKSDPPGEKNKYLHLIVTLSGHPVASIGDVYFDDQLVPLDANGNATGHFEGFARVRKHLGAYDQVADPLLIAESSRWTSEHRGRGCAYLYVRLLNSAEKFPTGYPNISAETRGKLVLDPRDNTTNFTQNPALIQADYLTDSKLGLGSSRGEVNTAHLIASANVSDEMVNVDAESSSATFSAGSVTLDSEIADLKTGNGVRVDIGGVSTNRFYIRISKTAGKLASSLTNAYRNIAMTSGTGSGSLTRVSEPRYTCNGVTQASELPEDIINNQASAHISDTMWIGGSWIINSGAHRTSTISLDENDLIGGLSVQTKQPRLQSFNGVRGVYVSRRNDFQPSDFTPVVNGRYLSEDNNERSWLDVDLPFTDSNATSQRIGKVLLEQGRQGIQAVGVFKLTAFSVQAGDTIALSNKLRGWSNKLFKVVGYKFTTPDTDDGGSSIGIELTLRETASGVWDWNNGEETTRDLAPNTNLPSADQLDTPPPPTLTSGTDELFLKKDGTLVTRMKISWNLPSDLFVTQGGRIEIQYKRTADTDWIDLTDVPGTALFTYAWEVQEGISYDARIRFINSIGVPSEYSPFATHVVVGKSELPGVPTDFVARGLIDGIQLEWTNVDDADLSHVEIARGDAVDPSTHLINIDGESHDDRPLELGRRYYYRIRSVDTSKNPSAWTTSRSAVVGDLSEDVGAGSGSSQTRISISEFSFGTRVKIFELNPVIAALYFNPNDPQTTDRMAITATDGLVQIALGANDEGSGLRGSITSDGTADFKQSLRVADQGAYRYLEAGVTTAVDIQGCNLRIFDAAGVQRFRVDNTDGQIYINDVAINMSGGTAALWAQEGDTSLIPDSKFPIASTSQRGIVQKASDAAITSGTNNLVYVTPANVVTMIEARTDSPIHTLGVIRAQISDRVENFALEANPTTRVPTTKLPNASTSSRGIVRQASTSIVTSATNNDRYITAFHLRHYSPAPSSTQVAPFITAGISTGVFSWARTGNTTRLPVSKLPNSSTSSRGIVQQSTSSQAIAGTNNDRYVTPFQLKNYAGGGDYDDSDVEDLLSDFNESVRFRSGSRTALSWNGGSGDIIIEDLDVQDSLTAGDQGSYNMFEAGVTTAVDIRGVNLRVENSSGTQRFRVDNSSGYVYVRGTKVLGTRRTGWGVFAGAVSRQGFNTNNPSNTTLGQRLSALIQDLRAHGLIS